MNQVMEMLRLEPGASEADAVTRLSTLFEIMKGAKGFRDAEVLHNIEDPRRLLVLHTWDHVDDWYAFRTSETKMAFSAARPAFLYTFEPCGMNWLLDSGEEAASDAPFLHRQISMRCLQPLTGSDLTASQTFTYQDYEPSLEGAMLRLTRSRSMPNGPRLAGEDVLDDDVYESVYRAAGAAREAFQVAG